MHKIKILLMITLVSLSFSSCALFKKKPVQNAPQEEKTPLVHETPKEAKSSPAPSSVWVAKSDGSKSCGEAEGVKPEVAVKALKKIGVKVQKFRKGSDGMMHTMQCGGSTGVTIEVKISFKDLAKAQKQGFEPMLPQPN